MEQLLQSLRIEPAVMGMQMALFILLWISMNHLFWKPMLQHLRARDNEISGAYKTVSNMQHEMETLRSDYQARITQIEADARAKIQDAIKEAQAERERLLSEAKLQADTIVKQGAADMDREKTEAMGSLGGWMSDLAHSAVTKALGAVSDPAALKATINRNLAIK